MMLRLHSLFTNSFPCARFFAANFTLPDEGQCFDKVEFAELNRSEAQELVDKYNKEGNANLPPDYRRYKQHDRYSRGIVAPSFSSDDVL